ncbi:hypothetical protein EQG49_02570 [Periweissella cryptocerci]|uniref:Lipoprotein n=1 Tax=Periweissella cryptocerci TaxID=2506420 RepID=A0A4P6YRY2_9LACO|nr:hypothetical protein [Periweissella cryptocerci]QBO35427.1 hypothetical protein EQG49_02570 [Periweissella cryptocerci]
MKKIIIAIATLSTALVLAGCGTTKSDSKSSSSDKVSSSKTTSEPKVDKTAMASYVMKLNSADSNYSYTYDGNTHSIIMLAVSDNTSSAMKRLKAGDMDESEWTDLKKSVDDDSKTIASGFPGVSLSLMGPDNDGTVYYEAKDGVTVQDITADDTSSSSSDSTSEQSNEEIYNDYVAKFDDATKTIIGNIKSKVKSGSYSGDELTQLATTESIPLTTLVTDGMSKMAENGTGSDYDKWTDKLTSASMTNLKQIKAVVDSYK